MEYEEISICEIEVLEKLWLENGIYYSEISEFFTKEYKALSCEERREYLEKKLGKKIKITIVVLDPWELKEEKRQPPVSVVGYCISMIQNQKGAIASIYLLEEYRGKGVGKRLVGRHMEWFTFEKCKFIEINVPLEQNRAINFYEKLGFKSYVVPLGAHKH